MTLKHNTIIR